MELDTFLRTLPKTELHVHITGSVQLATLVDLAAKYGFKLPYQDQPEELYDRSEFNSILHILKIVCELLREPDDFHRIAYETQQEAARNGVRYREIFWNPTDHIDIAGIPYKTAQDGFIAGLREAEADFAITGRLIPSINREDTPEKGYQMVEDVLNHRHDWSIGIGMDYLEVGHPPEKFWKAYRLAQQGGLRRTAHAGEFLEPARNVETCLDLLECDRIDHGYTIVDNPELLQRCLDEQTLFTVVPSNTTYLRLLHGQDFRQVHPLRKMGDLGLRIFPNSDDPPLHHTDPGFCYIAMVRDYGFDLDAIRSFVINSIDAAWIDESDKRQWRQNWLREFDDLRAQLDEESLDEKAGANDE